MNPDPKVDDYLWHIAYGANMNPKVLGGRRGVYPKESVACFVPGYSLGFNMMGFPYIEPAFGSIVSHAALEGLPDEEKPTVVDGHLHAVAHYITWADMRRIQQTEGGHGHPDYGYQLVMVSFEAYDGRQLSGLVLVSHANQERAGIYPSARYHALVLEGARDSGLDAEYISKLAAVPPYEAVSAWHQYLALTAIIGCFWPLVLAIIGMFAVVQKYKVAVPKQFPRINFALGRGTWLYHDYILQYIFGSGAKPPRV